MKSLLCVLSFFVVLLFPIVGHTLNDGEEQKIQALLQLVGAMTEEKFIRNGKEYNAVEAVELIRYKYEKEKAWLTTATDFIEHCAASSSTTGQPYQIKFPDGTIRNSEDFLKEKLKQMEKNGSTPES